MKDEQEQIKHYGQVFRQNDKVIQLVNRAEKGIMNGDVGYIDSFIYKDLKIIGLRVAFDQNIIEYTIEELEDLSLAYAISVHKAQGGEFDIVIMPISSKHFIMLKRKLIYTAITRAKKILILIGDVQMMQQGIRKIENNRKTILKNKLIEYINTNVNEDNPKQTSEKIIEDDDELGSIFSELKASDFDNFNS
ncbi:MAG: ATP-binding domain-containing protein [Bacilli bacterium]